MAPTITAADHVVLCVDDMDRSVAWYGDVLGLDAERYEEWRSGRSPFVSLRVSDSFLIDLVPAVPDGRNVDHVALVTDRPGFDAFVVANRSAIEMGPAMLSGARGRGEGVYVRDPDGNRIEVRTYDTD